MSRQHVYVTLQQFCEQDQQPRDILEAAGFEVRQNTLGRRLRREELPEALRDADAVLAGVETYDAELFATLPRLRCISRCGVGTDAIDHHAAKQFDIEVFTTTDEVVEPVAQMTVAMMLALARHLPLHWEDLRAGRWLKRSGVLLSEWTIGLVGFGQIGRAVEGYLRGFGPRVLVTDPQVKADDMPDRVTLCDLRSLLSESDLVSIHALRPQDEGVLIGRCELAIMKRSSYLVNTARGYMVDETALCDALASGHLAGAALDVFETEPYAGPLANFPQVLCTPHVATLTRASRVAMELHSAQNIVEFFARTPLGAQACT